MTTDRTPRAPAPRTGTSTPDHGGHGQRDDSNALFDDLPSLTNRSFHPLPIGDSFGYPGQGGYGEELRWRGYGGMGPAGNWRTDARIQEDLHEQLTDSEEIDATLLVVAVSDGVVTLNGQVPERRMKHLAEELAAHCKGVCEVDNRIEVGPDPHSFGPRGEAVRTGDAIGSGFSGSTGAARGDRSIGDTGASGVANVPDPATRAQTAGRERR